MVTVPPTLRILLAPIAHKEESAKDLIARAQTASDDGQRGSMLRTFAELHALLVPSIDALIERQSTVSSALGLLGLWDDLLDIDVERENILELLTVYAAQLEAPESWPLPDGLSTQADIFAAQQTWLTDVLTHRAHPKRQWWRRLTRRARGPLGDRARLTVERSALRIFEHLPSLDEASSQTATTRLGSFQAGDRMTLAVQVPLPGQLAIVHACGDESTASLDVVLPETVSEADVRRHHEVVEVHGELSAHTLSASAPLDERFAEQALIVIWVPELMPPSWIVDMQLRYGVPPEARVWRYLYRVHT